VVEWNSTRSGVGGFGDRWPGRNWMEGAACGGSRCPIPDVGARDTWRVGSDTPVRQRLLAELATRVPNVCVTDVGVDPAFGALRMAAKKFGLK